MGPNGAGPAVADLIAQVERYRRLLDNIPAEIGVFDPQGRFLFNTPSGIRDPAVRQWVLGRTHHEYCRKRNYPLELADRRQRAIEQVAAEGKSISFEELWIDKQGQRRHYVRTFSPVIDQATGTVSQVIGYGQEITELKQAEDALRTALEELEALKNRLHEENVYLREEIRTQHNFDEILGDSPAIVGLRRAIGTVGPTEATVLIQGETGTGKELVARAIHAVSARGDKPLIRINCASVPEGLFESEFFGHVRGAFTGAVKDRAGRFELASGGTLFLDEVGEIPLAMQSKLLRVIQEGEVERVGSARTCRVDVRIIAATNRDLKQEVEAGRFRDDLYYRLGVFPIEVAPLRARPEDIPLLATHYLEQVARRLKRPIPGLSPDQLARLQAYDWPGNVRELQNVVERALIATRNGALHIDLPTAPTPGLAPLSNGRVLAETDLLRHQRENLLAALRRTGWRIHGPRGAARLLGLKPTTLASRMKRLGLSRPSNEIS